MILKFFTQQAYIASPTFHKHFEGKHETRDQDYPFVNMTADIIISESGDENDNPQIDVSVHNKMWDDPLTDKDGNTEPIHLNFTMDRKEVAYLHKYLEAFLKTNPSVGGV